MKPDQSSSASCEGCGTTRDLCLLLYNVRYRASQRRFCTNCVLKKHEGLFCPICFDVYDDSPPPHLRLMCHKCPSFAHRSCVVSSSGSDSTPPFYLCPPCADPKFTYFKLTSENPTVNKANGKGDKVDLVAACAQNAKGLRAIDLQSAKVLVAAARIAASSMTKAAAAARIDAERRCKEAALARKKAREALERVAYLAAKEKDAKGFST
ncbi:uncharacterized protein LOC114718762 [Neltuma alba]|uniref:uncharacterized protein LOC114718762 n=1 Tax=Neltuma alba TaxID=207710 RepID=UPI0010A3538B|nr:uncharacterized protein LOC114718762 [Prosopis alba]